MTSFDIAFELKGTSHKQLKFQATKQNIT